MNDFFINVMEESAYPSSEFYFNPDNLYPEYPWSIEEISREKNDVYNMVRSCFAGLKMDYANYGTKKWNPFREIIREGDTIVIKPNWVMHYNKNIKIKEHNLECLITHPSVVRAVTDYCIIALNGTGKIIIGDAPMQGCDLDKLMELSGYNKVFKFYNDHLLNIHPTDFRQYSVVMDKHKILKNKKYNTGESLSVDLGIKSKFSDNPATKRYKVSDYPEKLTNRYHSQDKHTYSINKDVLSADVVINLPKPKCHRLSGITAAVKNMVGITADKACLPHRTAGSKYQGGDEYLNNSIIKKIIGKILDKKIDFEDNNSNSHALIMRYAYGVLFHLMKLVSKDKFLLGSWYGNDTIWRTALDLLYILLYADKEGKLNDKKQRRVFNIADMVISGQRNGPIAPEPKKLGIIIAGYDSVMMDRLVCEIMGFDYKKVPSIFNAVNDTNLMPRRMSEYKIDSNMLEFSNKSIDELHFPKRWRFEPHDSWKGFVEK